MRNTMIILTAALTMMNVIGCGNTDGGYGEDAFTEYENAIRGDAPEAPASGEASSKDNSQRNSRSKGHDDLEMKPIIDKKTGRPAQYMPLPESWNITSGGITGPGNVRVKETPYQSFNTYQYPVMSARQIANNMIASHIAQQGGRITQITDLPEMAKKDLQNLNQFAGSNGYRKYCDAVGVDMVDGRGNPSFVIVHQMYFDMGGAGMWGYALHTLTSNKSVFESAKRYLVFGLLNTQTEREYIAGVNSKINRETHESWTAHNARMRSNAAANDAAFQATQRAYTSSSNSISDIYMDTWKNTNAASDRMQAGTVQGIRGTETVQDPMYGGQYEVQSGYDRYFMNNQGQYTGTNDQFYQTGSDLYAEPDAREVYRKNK